jgi:gliding motility-associated-like protein
MKNIFLTLSLIFTGFVFSQDPINFTAANNNTTVNTCNGFIIDSGGQGGTGYGNNENVTITICPDTITSGNNDDFINIVFNFFSLDGTDTNPAPNANNQDYMNVYDGPSTASNFLGVYSGTGLANTTIQATNLNPTGCITLQFVSNDQNAGGSWGYTASATCSTPCDSPVSGAEIVGGAAVDSILVCVGDLVDFIEVGSIAQAPFTLASYEWNFMDGTTAVGAQGGTVQHAYSQPGHYVVNLFVTDDNAFTTCLNANLNELNVFVATPPTFYNFPNDTSLCIGEFIDLTAQPQVFDSLWSGFPGSAQIDDGCMSDTLLGVAQVVPITMTGFDEPTITDAAQIESICLDMEHSYMGDLVIQVECPGGTIITLHQQGGGGTQIGVPVQTDDVDCINGLNQGTPFTYCFTPQATDTWVEWVANNGWGQTLPAGDYEPVAPLAGLVGCPISGTWNLIVTDNWGADDGTVFGWSINLVDSLYPDVVQFTPNIGENSDSSFWAITDPFVTNVSADGNVVSIVPTVAGSYDYTYSVWDDFGCFNDSTITITVDDQINVSAGLDTSICNGQPVVLGGSGAGGVGCNYSLDLVDTFGDGWNGNSIDVTINGVNTNYSPGGSGQTVALNVSHGDIVTLQWNATGSWQSENEIYLYDGDGNLVYSNGAPGTPSTTLGNITVDCFGGLTFIWTPDNGSLSNVNTPSPTVTNPAATTVYTLGVYPNGHPACITYDDVTVSIGGGLDAGLDSVVIICKEAIEQDLFQYVGGNPQVGGVWFNAAGDTILMPVLPDTLVDGLYEYKRDSAGCFVSAFVDVTILEITLSALIDHSDCNAFNGEVKLIASANAMNPIQYSNDAGVTSTANDLFSQGFNGGILGGMGGSNLYSFHITDGNGCVASIDSVVIDDNFPEIDINSIVTVDSDCSADNGQVTAVTVNGGTPNYTFSTDGVVYAPLGLTDLAPNANYDLIAHDNFGCTDTVQIAIVEINTPEITSFNPTNVSCYTAGDGTIDVSGNNLMSYTIDFGATFQTTGLFENLAPGAYVVTAYSGPNGTLCNVSSGQVVISEPNPLQIDTLSNALISTLSNPLVVCSGDEILLGVQGSGGNGNYTYDWNYLGNSLGQGTTLTTSVTNDMQICVTMSEDCPSPTVTECMNVVLSPEIYPALTSDVVDGCYPLTVVLTNDSNTPLNIANSTWIFTDDNVSNNVVGGSELTHTFQDPGVYDVSLHVVSNEGCEYDTTYSQYYDVYDHPDANYTYSTIPLTVYDSEANFTDYSTGDPVQWAWNFGTGATPLTSTVQNPVIEYPEGVAAVYPTSLQVWNEFGCFDILEGQVEVINDVTCFAPNIFTPDGDEFNETWRVFISGIDIYDFHVTMFNRWGEVVWESYDATAEWDGSYASDGTIQDGSYVWILHAKDSYNDKKYEFNGTVTIVR